MLLKDLASVFVVEHDLAIEMYAYLWKVGIARPIDYGNVC
jgi:hypothetical protein